jgi:hypothetical protein
MRGRVSIFFNVPLSPDLVTSTTPGAGRTTTGVYSRALEESQPYKKRGKT